MIDSRDEQVIGIRGGTSLSARLHTVEMFASGGFGRHYQIPVYLLIDVGEKTKAHLGLPELTIRDRMVLSKTT